MHRENSALRLPTSAHLQGANEGGGCDDRVPGLVRQSRVAAPPQHRDVEAVGRRHDGADLHCKVSNLVIQNKPEHNIGTGFINVMLVQLLDMTYIYIYI